MVKKEELCPDAQRLLCEGVPLRALGDGTWYFLYPMNKTDYNIASRSCLTASITML